MEIGELRWKSRSEIEDVIARTLEERFERAHELAELVPSDIATQVLDAILAAGLKA